jgi:hypothetical protein
VNELDDRVVLEIDAVTIRDRRNDRRRAAARAARAVRGRSRAGGSCGRRTGRGRRSCRRATGRSGGARRAVAGRVLARPRRSR